MANKVYKTWRDFLLGEWRWPNFSPQELASRREGELLVDPASMGKFNANGCPMQHLLSSSQETMIWPALTVTVALLSTAAASAGDARRGR